MPAVFVHVCKFCTALLLCPYLHLIIPNGVIVVSVLNLQTYVPEGASCRNWNFVLSLYDMHGRTVVLSVKITREYHPIKQNKSSLSCCLSTSINYNLFYYVTSNIIINPSICCVYHYLYIALW